MRPADAITQADAARLLGVTSDTVAKMVRRGELRSYRSKPSLSRRQVEAVAEMRRRFRDAVLGSERLVLIAFGEVAR